MSSVSASLRLNSKRLRHRDRLCPAVQCETLSYRGAVIVMVGSLTFHGYHKCFNGYPESRGLQLVRVISRNKQTPTKKVSTYHLSHINKYLYVWIHYKHKCNQRNKTRHSHFSFTLCICPCIHRI